MSIFTDEQVAQQMCDAVIQDFQRALSMFEPNQREAAFHGLMAGIGNIIAISVPPAQHDLAILRACSVLAQACKGKAAMDAQPAGHA